MTNLQSARSTSLVFPYEIARIEKGPDDVRRSFRILAATLVALAQSATAVAPASATSDALSRLAPFRPTSLVNEDAAVCEPFLAGWTEAFDGTGNLDEDAVDLAALYPQGQVSMVPEEKHPDNYSERSSYSLAIDFDGDGENEVLSFKGDWIGWRFQGVVLSLFDSEADFARTNEPDHPPAREIYKYRPIGRARILKIGAKLYTMERPDRARYDSAAGSTVSLVELNAPPEPRTVCKVALLPEASSFADVIETMPLFQATRDVYGTVDYACLGSMGWTAPPFDATLPRILYRPWTLRTKEAETLAEGRQRDVWRETLYLGWGLSDPQSWRDYLEVKASRRKFIADVAAYYRSTGTASSRAEAKDLAERAWRLVLDTLIYNPYLMPFARRDQATLPITPASSPETIVRLVIDAWLTKQNDASYGSAQDLLLAAIYTRQPLHIVRELADRVEHDFATSLAKTSDAGSRENKATAQDAYWRKTLVAALGHNELTSYFLDRADPDSGTNGFGKTALMYAAQHDRLNAVRLLLERGVKVDTVTDSKKTQSGCGWLDRDHRTALMYAAENASPAVVDALLDAGANVTAMDTKGNTPLWYFSRNAKVANPAERARLIRRLGG